jgi:hypothetical protein
MRAQPVDGIPPMTDALAELPGTAILMAVGLSAVTLDFSTKSPLYGWLGVLPTDLFDAEIPQVK